MRSSSTGELLGKPWVTFMVDAYSRRLLAVYLTFDPPSYRSVMMAHEIRRRLEKAGYKVKESHRDLIKGP